MALSSSYFFKLQFHILNQIDILRLRIIFKFLCNNDRLKWKIQNETRENRHNRKMVEPWEILKSDDSFELHLSKTTLQQYLMKNCCPLLSIWILFLFELFEFYARNILFMYSLMFVVDEHQETNMSWFFLHNCILN